MRVFRLLLCCLSLRAVFASGVTAQDSDVPIRISNETTYITSPLRNDGTVDYIEALSQRQREGSIADLPTIRHGLPSLQTGSQS